MKHFDESYTLKAFQELLAIDSTTGQFRAAQDWITAETECLGNMRTLDIPAAARRIRELPGNRDWGAFYDAGLLPGRELP